MRASRDGGLDKQASETQRYRMRQSLRRTKPLGTRVGILRRFSPMTDARATTPISSLGGFALLLGAGALIAGVAAVLFADVGPESGALATARKELAHGDGKGALAALVACATRDRRACGCADQAGELAIDMADYQAAWPVVDRAQCG